MEKCQITPIVRALLEMKQKQMSDKNIEAIVVGDATVKCNKDAMSRALDNLISNAVNYSEQGKKIEIIIDSDQMIINNYFSDKIECNIKKLTEPFVKGSESRTAGGTGLGLNIAKTVMDIHGFRMRIEIENNMFKIRIKW
jgi:signal transduction histidine kinase